MTIGDHVEISPHPGVVLKGRVLAIVDWDGVDMLLIRYDEGEPAKRPWTVWPEDEAKVIE